MSARLQAIAGYRAALDDAIDKGIYDEVERALALYDLFYLLTAVLNRRDINHDWLFDRCREVQESPNGHLDLWPRDHRKSSIITFGLTIQDILNDPELTVGIFSFNKATAKKFLFQIKYEMETNERLKRMFPEILWSNPDRQAPMWALDEGIIVKRTSNRRECTIEAWGLVDSQPTSKHFRLMVYDDVLTQESVSNPDMIAKVTRSWETSRALRTEDGRSRYVGTRWAQNDTYKVIIDRKSAKPRVHRVTFEGTADGEPVLMSREWVSDQRRDMGPYVFAAQMLMDPAADRVQGFKDDWIRYYKITGDSDFRNMNKYLLVDGASEKKKSSDYTAMALIGLATDGNYYLLDAIRDRLSLTERADAVFSLHRRWKPKAVGYEKYGAMADVEHIKDRQDRENYRFEIIELGGQVPKPDRIRKMIPIFETGRFHLPESLLKVDYEGRHVDLVQSFLNDEYRSFPVALHDDMFDTISRIVDPAMPAVWPKEAPAEDRYARGRNRARRGSWMAA